MIEKKSILITVRLFIPIFSLGGTLFRNVRRGHRIEVSKDEYPVHPYDE